MLKKCLHFLLLSLCLNANHLLAVQDSNLAPGEWGPCTDVAKTVAMMTQVATQLPQNVLNKMQTLISFNAGLVSDEMHYILQSHYSDGDMWAGTMELSIVEHSRRVGRKMELYYSVEHRDLGHVRDQMGTEPNQGFSEEESTVTDARKMAEIMLQVSGMLAEPSRDRMKNIGIVTGRMEENATVFHIVAHYPAGDFWRGTLELNVTETPRRVGRRLINNYSVVATDLGAE
jgi:hypothetical protein